MSARTILAALLFAGALLAETPQRIVSAAPSITEMLYALGLGDRVVGVTTFCHYPPEVRDKPKIGTYLRPNLETVLAMRPDLVAALAEHGAVVEQFQRLGLPTLTLQHNDLAGIYRSLEQLGERTGARDAAAREIEQIQEGLAAVRARAAGRPERSVLFLVGRTPSEMQDLIAVGRGSFLNELIAIAGGRNLLDEAPSFYPHISVETLYVERPQVVIDMGDMADTDRIDEAHRRSVVALWRKEFPDLPAVGEGRVYAVANDIFVVPGPRVVEAAEALLEMIHPEAGP